MAPVPAPFTPLLPVSRLHRFLTEFERFLRSSGLKLTNQRRLLAEVVMDAPSHLTTEDLVQVVRKRGLRIGRATVYRTIHLLRQAGLVQGHDFGEGTVQYEPALGERHHDHLRCTDCGQIVEFTCGKIEKLQEEMARRHRFQLSYHRLEMFGLCHRCQARQGGRAKPGHDNAADRRSPAPCPGGAPMGRSGRRR
ncbi:MAG: transcriptional repressor [Candidatus Riflebacteria bacterium]|nr:transcriptional repressor [Candidatus Riflebacteria bacterium]